MRRRLDAELVRRGLVANNAEAREAVATGRVVVAGRPAFNPGSLVAVDEPVSIGPEAPTFASRGGHKLAAALDRFPIDVRGRRCLDAGAATGGFTDALLSRGAGHVVAVDVGYGELAWKVRNDPRVTVMERTNVRSLHVADLPYRPDLIVADLSFTSLVPILPALAAVAAPAADVVLLVKPQFEAERDQVEPGGVVSDPAVWQMAIERVAGACAGNGIGTQGVAPSSLPGPAGNIEFFLHARAGQPGVRLDIDAALREAEALRRPGDARGTTGGRDVRRVKEQRR